MRLFLDAELRRPRAGRAAAVGRSTSPGCCLPQVFFYGMFVLVGQILNARGRFGPMMWAPIANNVDRGRDARHLPGRLRPGRPRRAAAAFTAGQELLLGIGSTLGIVAAAADPAALPARRRLPLPAALRLPRRRASATPCGSASGRCCSSSSTRSPTSSWSGSASSGTAGATARRHRLHRLLHRVPDHDGPALDHHRLAGHRDPAPALAPYAADDRPAGLGRTLGSTLRTALALVVPFAALLPVLATDAGQRALRATAPRRRRRRRYAPTLALFGAGLVFFTVHYLMLRGFYALEHNRTVFFIQCAVAATNIVAGAAPGRAGPTPATPRRRWCWPTPRRTPSARRRRTPCCAALLGGLRHPGAGALPGPAAARRRPCRAGRLAVARASALLLGACADDPQPWLVAALRGGARRRRRRWSCPACWPGCCGSARSPR